MGWAAAVGFVACLLAICSGCSKSDQKPGEIPPPAIREGQIGRAVYRYAVPFHRSGKLLVLAHGMRPRKAPLLAHLDMGDPAISGLLEQGWIVAATSYRRNGLILEDGVRDVRNLVGLIAEKEGPASITVVEGSSLGGAIGLMLAESEGSRDIKARQEYRIDGVVAIGVDPSGDGPAGPAEWTYDPTIPVLLVSNRTEFGEALGYVRKARGRPFEPAIWRLDRDGHVNINAAERLAAIQAVEWWLDSGQRPVGSPPEGHDATVPAPPRRSTARISNYGVVGRVRDIGPSYGNVTTDLVVSDLTYMGLLEGDRFVARCGKVRRSVIWGTTYNDVSQGEFVAFFDADGFLRLAVNMGNAAKKLKCVVGDDLEILKAE